MVFKGRLITAFYNGLSKKKTIEIGNARPIFFELIRINLFPPRKIQSDKVEFKTLSPILINQKGDNLNYIAPTHEGFEVAFKSIIVNQALELNVPCQIEEINFEIKAMKKLPLTHYNQTMTSWLGEFVLEAPKEVLQLVYDTGIGVRRSQGFGMLDILKQY